MKFFESTHTYDYPLPTVSLAYFLRYPNPLATHVLSSDVISRHVDPVTNRLHTTRLHLKQSKLPPAILKVMPKSFLGNLPRGLNGEAQNFILEKSVVDVREGWMETETQNLQYTGVLSVIERQRYTRPTQGPVQSMQGGLIEATRNENTNVTTAATFRSRFGLTRSDEPSTTSNQSDDVVEKRGVFSSWSTAALQRTIESTGMQRTRNALTKSKEGMNIVLERIRMGGLMGALDGMRRDREMITIGVGGGEGAWSRTLREGQREAPRND